MRLLIIAAMLAVSAFAGPIDSLFGTGHAGSGGTSIDGNWTVNGHPAYITSTSGFPFPNWGVGSWISPRATYVGGLSDPADTTFIFSTGFTLPGNFSSASITLQVATDNALTDVRLNGTSVGFTPTMIVLPGNTTATGVLVNGTGFGNGRGAPLSITSGFQAGRNTLDLYVRNSTTDSANAGNPVGLDVAISGDFTTRVTISDIPEPSSVVLVACGFVALALLLYRRRWREL